MFLLGAILLGAMSLTRSHNLGGRVFCCTGERGRSSPWVGVATPNSVSFTTNSAEFFAFASHDETSFSIFT